MPRYRNRMTGAVIETYGELHGENWEKVGEASASSASPVSMQEQKPVTRPSQSGEGRRQRTKKA